MAMKDRSQMDRKDDISESNTHLVTPGFAGVYFEKEKYQIFGHS